MHQIYFFTFSFRLISLSCTKLSINILYFRHKTLWSGPTQSSKYIIKQNKIEKRCKFISPVGLRETWKMWPSSRNPQFWENLFEILFRMIIQKIIEIRWLELVQLMFKCRKCQNRPFLWSFAWIFSQNIFRTIKMYGSKVVEQKICYWMPTFKIEEFDLPQPHRLYKQKQLKHSYFLRLPLLL